MENNNLNLNDDEKNIIEKVNNIYDSVKTKNKNVNDIINNIKYLVNDDDDKKYLKALLFPEKYKGIKMYNQVPLASCTFQLHSTKLIDPYNKEFRLIFNPFFLYDSTYTASQESVMYQKYGSKVYPPFTRDKTGFYYFYLTSFYKSAINTTEEKFVPVDIDQGIPGFYSHYRLISACIMLKYIGKLDEVSGILGGTIITEDCPFISGSAGYRSPESQKNSLYFLPFEKYYDYKQFMNSPYHRQYNCIDGIKLVYFPIDNSYEEFCEIFKPENIINVSPDGGQLNLEFECDKNYKSGFYFYIYGLGLPENTKNNFKLDIYCNYECLANPKFLNFLPINIYNNNLNIKKKQNIINFLRSKCVKKINDYDNLLDWKQILKQIKKKKVYINYDKLNTDIKNLDEEYEKLKDEINKEMDIENNVNNEINMKNKEN